MMITISFETDTALNLLTGTGFEVDLGGLGDRSRSRSDERRRMKFVRPLTLYQELMKTKPERADRLIGIVVGLRHVSFAVTDRPGKDADRSNVLAIEKNISAMVANRIEEELPSFMVAGLVFGLPYGRLSSPLILPTMTLIDELRESGKFQGLKYSVWDTEDLPEAHDPKCEHTVAAVALQDYLDMARKCCRNVISGELPELIGEMKSSQV
ncbi:hypothetical protein EZV62_015632 [Acer yangbiense]|uniref:Uncharacterized protein n=1 Tax=Acer yangbiense TaxID=1000413 RepID=A0A5C7HLD9_9ROSI|nr:hypothetical protein EZV62_015632 [Acer yangbiense]